MRGGRSTALIPGAKGNSSRLQGSVLFFYFFFFPFHYTSVHPPPSTPSFPTHTPKTPTMQASFAVSRASVAVVARPAVAKSSAFKVWQPVNSAFVFFVCLFSSREERERESKRGRPSRARLALCPPALACGSVTGPDRAQGKRAGGAGSGVRPGVHGLKPLQRCEGQVEPVCLLS